MPLAFSEEALARLCIGATRIAPQQRGRWLKKIAAEVEGHQPSPTARRLRKFQARRRNGQRCYRVVEDQIDLEEMLLASGTLAAADRDDHSKVEAALSRFISVCIADHRNAFQSDEKIYANVRIGLRVSALRKVSDGPPKPKRFRRK
jgi:hypothetical protein